MQEMQETQVRSLGWEDPLEEEMAITPVFLLGKSHGQKSLMGYSPQGRKESDTTERLQYVLVHFSSKVSGDVISIFWHIYFFALLMAHKNLFSFLH